jgi:hypothetical protein
MPRAGYRSLTMTVPRPAHRRPARQEVTTMATTFLVDALRQAAPAAVCCLGVAILWRGLSGGPHGKRGLLRPHAGSLGRVEGWRLTVLGLTVTGLGLAGVLEARWLVFLSLAFGFVETLEATMVIAAWRAGDRRATAARNRIRPGSRVPHRRTAGA